MPQDKAHSTAKIKARAQELGFDLVGCVEATALEEYSHVDRWITKGFHGNMHWMEKNCEKRKDPRLLVPGAKTILVTATNYYTSDGPSYPKISTYALGKDYHIVIKDRLYALLDFIRTLYPKMKGRAFVDSAPVLEKAWAVRAGLGWQGKNTLLIHRDKGSYLFLGELVLDVQLEYEEPEAVSLCGKCRKCLDACPTGALVKPGVLDARKCISYLTIEKQGRFPDEFTGKTEGYIFGCDICQQVCPWNKRAQEHSVADFFPKAGLPDMKEADWLALTKEEFEQRFSDSPLSRPGLAGIQRNVKALDKKNVK